MVLFRLAAGDSGLVEALKAARMRGQNDGNVLYTQVKQTSGVGSGRNPHRYLPQSPSAFHQV